MHAKPIESLALAACRLGKRLNGREARAPRQTEWDTHTETHRIACIALLRPDGNVLIEPIAALLRIAAHHTAPCEEPGELRRL
eukprot:6172338-Pleurochrysis_carterae.AAC.1